MRETSGALDHARLDGRAFGILERASNAPLPLGKENVDY